MDVFEAFGIGESDLPTLGIHYTARGADDKYLLQGELTAESARAFVDGYLAGQIKPMGEGEEGGDGEDEL